MTSSVSIALPRSSWTSATNGLRRARLQQPGEPHRPRVVRRDDELRRVGTLAGGELDRVEQRPADLQADLAVARHGAGDVPLDPRPGRPRRCGRDREQWCQQHRGRARVLRERRRDDAHADALDRRVGHLQPQHCSRRRPAEPADGEAQQRAVEQARGEGGAATGGERIAGRRAGRVRGDGGDGVRRGRQHERERARTQHRRHGMRHATCGGRPVSQGPPSIPGRARPAGKVSLAPLCARSARARSARA